jgi:outer membrane protein assembly factor BamA
VQSRSGRHDCVQELQTLSEKKQRELLPLRREGNLDISVIEEGARRVKNRLQEQGYFFAESLRSAPVTPPTPTTVANGTRETCENLIPEALTGHTVTVTYDVDLKRRLTLTDIRVTGTSKLTPDDIAEELKSQKASSISFLPFIGGLGRGYTSTTILEEDRRTVEAHMRELGYRHAKATVLQGISLTGDSLIITFNVEEGPADARRGSRSSWRDRFRSRSTAQGNHHQQRRAVLALASARRQRSPAQSLRARRLHRSGSSARRR